MTFPTYSDYRDSELEGLDLVPRHWETVRLKRKSTIKYGLGEPPEYHDEGIPLIRATNVKAGNISNEGMVFVNPSEIPENRIFWLREGDIVVVRSGAYTGDSALVKAENCPCIAGFDMVVRPVECLGAFLKYVLSSRYLKENQIDHLRGRAAQPHLNAEELGNCNLLLPSKLEQSAIAAFLDRETGKIDGLVAEQERLIELLKEKRQAVISHAVTKGLDPSVSMKDSGIEWLGEVPEH